MRILHFSDTHAAGLPADWWAAFDKRCVGIFNHTFFRMHRHRQSLLGGLVDAVRAHKPQVVVCTGDVTTCGEPDEFACVQKMLAPVVEDPAVRFFYVPGNHDAYVADPKCAAALSKAFHYLNQGVELDSLPTIIPVGNVEFCLLNQCEPNHLLLSCGRIRRTVERRVRDWAESPRPLRKIIVGHYPFLFNNESVRWRHRLYGHHAIKDLIRSRKIDLSLCGHVHVPLMDVDDSGRGEVVSGSLTRNAQASIIDYDDAAGIFRHSQIPITDKETQ